MILYKIEKIAAFYPNKDVLSNFHKCKIIYDGKTFTSSEQLFMYSKALFFNDRDTSMKILLTNNPAKHKKLGRQIKNYSDEVWKTVRYDIMKACITEKLKQNKEIYEEVKPLQLEGYTFVEGSPTDLVWGVGILIDNPEITNKKMWKGENLLGKIINEVLNEI